MDFHRFNIRKSVVTPAGFKEARMDGVGLLLADSGRQIKSGGNKPAGNHEVPLSSPVPLQFAQFH